MNNIYKKKTTESFEDYCHRISALKNDLDATWDAVAKIINDNTGYNYTADKYRKEFRRYQKSCEEPQTEEEIMQDTNSLTDEEGNIYYEYTPFDKESITINYEKDEQVSSREIPLTEEQLRNPRELLKAHGYDPENWELRTATNAKTSRRTPAGNTSVYSSRITIRPRNGKDITFADIDKYFESFDGKKYNRIKVTPKQYDADGEFLEICLQDIHMGLLSYEQETGEDYDVDIAKARLQNCMSDIYQRCKNRKFKRIVLVLLGDILHVDNLDGTTTKGTRQDVDTRPTRIFDEALKSLIEVVETLGNIAPVEVINIQGNHDRMTSYMLCKSLEMAFRGETNITFFNGPNPRKWRRYGKVLIGYGHGDLKVKNATEWLQGEASEDWGLSQFREVHFGHLHSLQTIQKIEDSVSGLITRYQPTLVASSAWEHKQGYSKNPKTMMSYVWNEDKGLREVWYSNI